MVDTRSSTLVRLREIAALTRRVGLKRTITLDESCDELNAVLDQLDSSDAPGTVVSAHNDLQELNEALKRESRLIRAEVEAHFHADLSVVLADVLRAQAEILASARVRVTVANGLVDPSNWQPPACGPILIGDRDDLAFILDNLVGNAIRAMSAMTRRELVVDWQFGESQILIRISDSGCGIPPDDWDRVLAGEGSTRAGGGLGFKRTQEILKIYRGGIWIEASQPGGGTVTVVSLHHS